MKQVEVGLVLTVLAVVLLVATVAFSGQSPQRTDPVWTVQQSGGNCVYFLKGKYVDQLQVVPIGPAGC